jgi:hypothetical protein
MIRRRMWWEPIVVALLIAVGSPLARAQPPPASFPPDVRPSPNICLPGSGSLGWCGDRGPATRAKLAGPQDLAEAPDGSLLVADTFNQVVRRIDPHGKITTIAGAGARGPARHDVPAQRATFRNPRGLAMDVDGSVLIADAGNAAIRRITTVGRVITFADAGFVRPTDVAVLPGGDYAVADAGGDRVLRVAPNGTVSPLAGTGERGFSGDGRPALEARLDRPVAIAPSRAGLLVADSGNGVVRRIDTYGTISTVAGMSRGTTPTGTPGQRLALGSPNGVVATAGGGFAVSDSARIWSVSKRGEVQPLAGTSRSGFNTDRGRALETRLDHPGRLVAGRDASLLIADSGNDRIRRVTVSGTMTTVAGSGRPHTRLADVVKAPFRSRPRHNKGRRLFPWVGPVVLFTDQLQRTYPAKAVPMASPDCGDSTTKANLLKIRPYSADVVKAKRKPAKIGFGVSFDARIAAYAWRRHLAYGKRTKMMRAGSRSIKLRGRLRPGRYVAVVVGKAKGGDRRCDARRLKVR